MNIKEFNMDAKPIVTIGIPNYNYAHYIITALNSVVDQTYQHIELIIVDDLSTDNSVSVVENWIKRYQGPVEIKFIKNKINVGLTKTCNIILQQAGGKYFQMLDADDMLLPFKIEKQVALLEASKNTALIYSNIATMNELGNVANADYLAKIGYNHNNMPQGNIFEKLFYFNFIPLPSVLINTANARIVGGFDETTQLQDYYLWFKLSELFETIFLDENTALYREHATSMINNSLTNPACVDSVLHIKFKYYRQCNKDIQKLIRNNIHSSAAHLYRYNYPTAKKWLKRDLLLNPGFKSFIYFAAINLAIPYSFFETIKTKFSSRLLVKKTAW